MTELTVAEAAMLDLQKVRQATTKRAQAFGLVTFTSRVCVLTPKEN